MRVQARFLYLLLFLIVLACSKSSNDTTFVQQFSGRYLYNSDEIIEAYFIDKVLFLKWRGAEKLKPLKIDDQTFFVKEMNEKIRFVISDTNIPCIEVIPKESGEIISSKFKKLAHDEKVPSEYFQDKNYEEALEGYLAIQANDSLDASYESNFNSLGYDELNKNKYNEAISIFEINVALFPDSPNVYDSLGEAYMKKGDTALAILNYKKSLEIDSGNRRAKDLLKKLEKE